MSASTAADLILYGWPYLGLAVGIAILVSALRKPVPRAPAPNSQYEPNRLHNIAFLFLLGVPLYMFHQFEEHGIDMMGRRYYFIETLCTSMYPPNAECPDNEMYILAVNVGMIWIASAIGAIYGAADPIIGATGCLAIPAINCIGHIVPAIASGQYNPGLLTAVVLFVPYTVWTYYLLFRRKLLSLFQIVFTLFSFGVVGHIAMISIAMSKYRGTVSEFTGNAILVSYGFGPLLAGKVFEKKEKVY